MFTVAVGGLAITVWRGTVSSPARPQRSGPSTGVQPPRSDALRAAHRLEPALAITPAPASLAPGAVPNDDSKPSGRAPEPAELAAQIDRQFIAEAVDLGWSAAAERLLRLKLTDSPSAGTELASISCRSSLCRVESLHDSVETFRAYVESSYLAREQQPWNGAVVALVTEQSEARVRAVSFIAKEGRDIPTAEPE